MARVDPTTPATRIAAERMSAALDDFVAGRPTYPSGTAFIGSDLEDSGSSVLDRARENKPVVIVYPDGEERFLVPSPHPRASTGPLERLWLKLRHRFR